MSQRIVKGAGHLVCSSFYFTQAKIYSCFHAQIPQEKPDALGEALIEILGEIMHRKGGAKM
jgi:hypothetical protein